ncbi:hypothetical protein ONZ45_g2596 [Pleurotus djamor]|nr:hypothetical protein ONZ45_g2596 [Pleurotus djamor]
MKASTLTSPHIAAATLGRSQELSDRVKQLADDIERAAIKVQDLLRGNVVERFLRGSDDATTLQSLDKEIQQAQSRFQVQGNVSIEVMVNELISATQTAELERQLGKLRTVDVGYRAPVNARKSRWLEGTRTQLLQDIMEWSQGLGTDRVRANAPIFVLTGGAGAGKSTIAVQVAKTLDEAGVLGGSFFFERGAEELSSTRYLFPPNWLGCTNELLVEPLSEVPQGQWPPRPIIFVLDALDECSDQDQVPSMLYLLLKRIRSLSFPIRLFLTTRPEYHIQDAFTSLEWQSEPEPYQLMSIPMNIVRDDIKRFINARLADIGLDQKLKAIQDDAVEKLTDAANGLFIYASTCIEFLGRYKHDLRETLALVLNHALNVDTLDALYDIVLSKAFSDNDFRHPHLGPSIPVVLGALSVMQEQLLPMHLSILLQLKTPVLNEVLDRLLSVLTCGANEPIRLLHASFPQYLVDPTRCRLAKISDSPSFSGHDYLARRCLEILLDGGNLKRNICDLPDPLVHRTEITDLDERRARSISPSIEYACLHWSFHLCRSSLVCDTTKLFKDFVERKLLQWMEALGMIGRSDVAVDDKTRMLLSDGYRFILTFLDAITLCPFQVYISGLGFSPSKSIIRNMYAHELDGFPVVNVLSDPLETWGSCLRVMEGHTSEVKHVVFSHHGRWIASAGADSDIILWDAAAGTLLRRLSGHSKQVSSSVFSSDDSTIFSGSYDHTIRVWNTSSGAPLRIIQMPTLVTHLALLSNPPNEVQKIAVTLNYGWRQHHLQIIDLDGRILKSLPRLRFFPRTQWSAGGKYLASTQNDKIVLYDTNVYSVRKELVGHKNLVYDIKVIPQSDLLVSGSLDTTVRLWRIETQTCLHTFKGHTGCVEHITVNPSKGFIVSASRDKTMRLWSIQEKTCLAIYMVSESILAVSFSPGGDRLVSADDDQILQLWDFNARPNFATLPEWSMGSFSLDLRFLVIRNPETKERELWSLRDDCLVATMDDRGSEVHHVAASPDGLWVAVLWSSGISLFNVLANRETSFYPGVSLRHAQLNRCPRNDVVDVYGLTGDYSDEQGLYLQVSEREGAIKVPRWYLFFFPSAKVEAVEETGVPAEYLKQSRLQERYTENSEWLMDRWNNRRLCWIPPAYRARDVDEPDPCWMFADIHGTKCLSFNRSRKFMILDLEPRCGSDEGLQTIYDCMQRANKERCVYL